MKGSASMFEFRYHAYRGMSWYFAMFFCVNLAFGIWGMAIVNDKLVDGVSSSGSGSSQDCGAINRFAKGLGSISIVECVVDGLLVYGIVYLVHGYLWAIFAVTLLMIYGLLVFLKAVFVILGVLWVWGDARTFCRDAAAPLYHHGDMYLKGCLVVVVCQYTLGTFCLISCGIHHAVAEAYSIINEDDEEFLDTRNITSFS